MIKKKNYNFNNINQTESYTKKFKLAMNDDFNTSEAIAVLFEVAKEINIVKQNSIEEAIFLANILTTLAQSIGLLFYDPEAFLHGLVNLDNNISEQEIQALIVKRNNARQAKNWQEADLIRDQLAKQGIYLEDKDNNTVWRKKI